MQDQTHNGPFEAYRNSNAIATAGSAGKEGPCAEIGAGLSSIISDIFKLSDNNRKTLVICGISAGLAAVFGAPISGSVFGVEVLSVGSTMYDVLMPSLIAGITAYHVSSALVVQYFSHKIDVIPVFSEIFLIKVIIAGLFFGICSFALIYSMEIGKTLFEKIKGVERFKGIIGGIFLIALTFIFSNQYLRLGLTTTEILLVGGNIIWYAFIMKNSFHCHYLRERWCCNPYLFHWRSRRKSIRTYFQGRSGDFFGPRGIGSYGRRNQYPYCCRHHGNGAFRYGNSPLCNGCLPY
jgi:hypothetical protein